MTDYQPLLARALKGLERNTSEARRSVYDRARQALLNQLRSATPPMADADITRERLALEDAIRKTETEAVLAEPHSVRASPLSRMPLSTRIGAQSPLAAPARTAPPVRVPAATAPEPKFEPKLEAKPAPADEAPPPPPAAPSGLTLPPSLLPAAHARNSSAQPAPGLPHTRPPVPPRARPPLPADETPLEEEAPAENVRPRAGAARRDPLHELSRELEPRHAPAARRGERPRPPAHDEMPRGPHPEKVAPPPPPPMRPRTARASVPGPGMPPGTKRQTAAASGNRTKILVAGAAVLLIAIAGVLAYTMRGRISGSSAPQAPVASEDQPKSSERVTQGPDETRQSAPTNLDPAVAQRAVLYEENPGGGQQFQNFVGTAVWKTEAVTGSGRAPELGLLIEIEIPDRHINVVMKMRKNNDPSFPASHTIEIMFKIPAGDAFGGVTDMRGIRAKAGETAQGNPIAAEVQKVKENYFLLALPQIEENTNLQMLSDRDWIDIPFVYANGRRAVLTFQKGTPGERAVREVFMSWGRSNPAAGGG